MAVVRYRTYLLVSDLTAETTLAASSTGCRMGGDCAGAGGLPSVSAGWPMP
jgi:hypothetical protein